MLVIVIVEVSRPVFLATTFYAYFVRLIATFSRYDKYENIKILTNFRHYSKLGLKTTEAACRIREMEDEIITDITSQNCLKLFKGADLAIEIRPRNQCSFSIDYDARGKPIRQHSKAFKDLGLSNDATARIIK